MEVKVASNNQRLGVDHVRRRKSKQRSTERKILWLTNIVPTKDLETVSLSFNKYYSSNIF